MSRTLSRLAALALAVAALAGSAAPSGAATAWSAFTDPSAIRAFATDGELVWAASRGGLLRLDPATGALSAIGTAEGLASADVSALLLLDGDLWIATADEGLQRYRPGAAAPWFRWQTFPQGLAADALHCLAADPVDGVWYGSSAGYGLIRGGEHIDLWNELNGLASSEVRSLAFVGDTLLVGTAAGLYRMDPGLNPEPVAGLPAQPVETIALAADSVWLRIGGQVFRNRLGSEEVWPQLALPVLDLEVKALAAAGDSLALSLGESGATGRADRVFRYRPGAGWTDLSAGLPVTYYSGYSTLSYEALLADAAGRLWLGGTILGSIGPGILRHDGAGWTQFPAEAFPMGNSFAAVCLGPSGRFWGFAGDGGAVYAEGAWTRYPRGSLLGSQPRFSLDVLEDSSGWVWFNRYGSAFSRLELATGTQELIAATGYALTRMVEDAAGNRWFARDLEGGDAQGGLDAYTAGGTWLHFGTAEGLPGLTIDNLAVLSPTRMALLFRGGGLGLFVWDHAGTLAATGDDAWLSVGDGIEDSGDFLLSDTRDFALAASAEGGLWVGQTNGLVRVTPAGANYRVRARLGQKTSFSEGLLGLEVHDLAVAPDGSVWVGTPLGLSRVRLEIENDGGTELLLWTVQSWTNEEGREQGGTDLFGPEVLAPLPSPDVFRVAVSAAGDSVWVATDFGLARLVITPDPPAAAGGLAEAWVYPNPVRLALGHQAVYLDGLAAPVRVSVYNLEGQLVRELGEVAPGALAWDLKTRFGKRAVSGVYLLRLEAAGETATRELVLVR